MFTRNLVVLPSNAAKDGSIKLRSLLDYFQDTATLAVNDVEGTPTQLYAKGYAWVLTRYEIEFTGPLPALDDEFTINTYHDPNHAYNCLRVFDVTSRGKHVVWAKSSWVLLDLAAGRPVKPIAHIEGIASRDTGEISPDFKEIPKAAEIIKSVDVPVMPHFLDYNAHVNNAVYFALVHDFAPIDTDTHTLKSICASFRSGAKAGETMTLNYSPEGLCYVMRQGVAKPSAQFLCVWEDRA